jgi:hypothetical protein
MPHATALIRISPGPGDGFGSCAIMSPAGSGAVIEIAFIMTAAIVVAAEE